MPLRFFATVLLMTCLMCTAVLPAFAETAVHAEAAPPVYSEAASFNQTDVDSAMTRLSMKSGGKLSVIPPLPTDTAGVTTCPNGYKKTGLFGYGILPYQKEPEWKDVGSWTTTSAISFDMTIAGRAEYSVWLKNTGTKNITGKTAVEFTLKTGGKVIADPVVADLQSTSIAPGQTILTTPVSAALKTSSLSAGSSIGVSIRVRYSSGKNGGDTLQLLYGTPDYASYVQFRSNAVVIKEVTADRKSVTAVYTDAFDIDWSLYGTNRASLYQGNQSVNCSKAAITRMEGAEGAYFVCTWGANTVLGANKVTARISYAGEDTAWVKNAEVNIAEEQPYSLPADLITILIIVALIIIIVAAYMLYKHRDKLPFRRKAGGDGMDRGDIRRGWRLPGSKSGSSHGYDRYDSSAGTGYGGAGAREYSDTAKHGFGGALSAVKGKLKMPAMPSLRRRAKTQTEEQGAGDY